MSSEVMVYIAIGAGSAALVAVIVVLTVLAWRRRVRSHIVTLIGGRETVMSAFRTVEKVSRRLAAASDGDLVAFALDSGSDDRRMLGDIAERMVMSAEDLQTMALPKRLFHAADALADAAELLGQQAERLSTGEGIDVLNALGELDLVGVVSLVEAADTELSGLRKRYRVADDTVYGGGLYI